MKLVLLMAGAAVVIGTAAPAYADDPTPKDQAFLNALSQAGLTYLNADRAITAGKQVCKSADDGMTGEEIVKALQDKNPGFQGPGAAKFAAIAASAYCPEKLSQTEDESPAPKPSGA